jgi:hypothetical protein
VRLFRRIARKGLYESHPRKRHTTGARGTCERFRRNGKHWRVFRPLDPKRSQWAARKICDKPKRKNGSGNESSVAKTPGSFDHRNRQSIILDRVEQPVGRFLQPVLGGSHHPKPEPSPIVDGPRPKKPSFTERAKGVGDDLREKALAAKGHLAKRSR